MNRTTRAIVKEKIDTITHYAGIAFLGFFLIAALSEMNDGKEQLRVEAQYKSSQR